MVGTMVPMERVIDSLYIHNVPTWEEFSPEIEDFLRRILTFRCLPRNFLKLHLLWHMEWEFYEPSTLENLAGWVYADPTETKLALDELCAVGLVRRFRPDVWEPLHYTLPDDEDLRVLIAKFFDAYHHSHEICERIIQRFLCAE